MSPASAARFRQRAKAASLSSAGDHCGIIEIRPGSLAAYLRFSHRDSLCGTDRVARCAERMDTARAVPTIVCKCFAVPRP